MLAVEVEHNEMQLRLALLGLLVFLSSCSTLFLDLEVSSGSADTSVYAYDVLAC